MARNKKLIDMETQEVKLPITLNTILTHCEIQSSGCKNCTCGIMGSKEVTHGGARKGAGRPKKEKTKRISVPVSKLPEIEKILKRVK